MVGIIDRRRKVSDWQRLAEYSRELSLAYGGQQFDLGLYELAVYRKRQRAQAILLTDGICLAGSPPSIDRALPSSGTSLARLFLSPIPKRMTSARDILTTATDGGSIDPQQARYVAKQAIRIASGIILARQGLDIRGIPTLVASVAAVAPDLNPAVSGLAVYISNPPQSNEDAQEMFALAQILLEKAEALGLVEPGSSDVLPS